MVVIFIKINDFEALHIFILFCIVISASTYAKYNVYC